MSSGDDELEASIEFYHATQIAWLLVGMSLVACVSFCLGCYVNHQFARARNQEIIGIIDLETAYYDRGGGNGGGGGGGGNGGGGGGGGGGGLS